MRSTRRETLLLASMAFLAGAHRAWPARMVRVGVLPFGTVGWEIETILRGGFDTARYIRIEPIKLASNDAARIAFQGGAVDTIVTDLLFAARLRAEGSKVKFLPFSSTEGAVMVPPAAVIASITDLRNKKIGIAGGPLDKSWLLLQAYARKEAGLDLNKSAEPVFGAPPLLMAKLEAGELDAALLYWNFCARLEAKGFRRLLAAGDIAKAFGVKGEIALLGYVLSESFARDAGAVNAFAAASRQAKKELSESDDAWAALRPLMQVEDEATFKALKRYFLAGVPARSPAEERVDAETLYAVLVALGGEKLVGPATRLPEGLYWEGSSSD